MAGDRNMEYRRMLVSLAKMLKEDEIRTMKFLCSDFIKKREMETIESVMDLWENLETKEKIGMNNLTFLKELVRNSCNGRLDVARIVEEYENNTVNMVNRGQQYINVNNQQHIAAPVYTSRSTVPPDMRGLKKEIDIITKHLGREWRFFMRALGLTDTEMYDIETDCPRNMREQIYRCLTLWVSDDRHNPNKQKLIDALGDHSVERRDLVHMLTNQ